MTATATKPKPAAPKPSASAKADTAPKTDTPAPTPNSAPAKAAPPSSYAPDEVRAKLVEKLAQLRADGWTRPAISAITGFSDSQVWRAQNDRVHTVELDRWVTFVQEVDEGKHKPPAGSVPKPKVADLQAKISAAVTRLAELDPKATAATLRKALADVKAELEA